MSTIIGTLTEFEDLSACYDRIKSFFFRRCRSNTHRSRTRALSILQRNTTISLVEALSSRSYGYYPCIALLTSCSGRKWYRGDCWAKAWATVLFHIGIWTSASCRRGLSMFSVTNRSMNELLPRLRFDREGATHWRWGSRATRQQLLRTLIHTRGGRASNLFIFWSCSSDHQPCNSWWIIAQAVELATQLCWASTAIEPRPEMVKWWTTQPSKKNS